jgi:hypothetical protein
MILHNKFMTIFIALGIDTQTSGGSFLLKSSPGRVVAHPSLHGKKVATIAQFGRFAIS